MIHEFRLKVNKLSFQHSFVNKDIVFQIETYKAHYFKLLILANKCVCSNTVKNETNFILHFKQIEREKCDLSVQVITLSERLEEAEGGAESQVCNII